MVKEKRYSTSAHDQRSNERESFVAQIGRIGKTEEGTMTGTERNLKVKYVGSERSYM
jgi:hypothetical protein